MDSWSEDDQQRWSADGEEDAIIAQMGIRQASLRIIAAQMAGQRTIQRNAEHLFHGYLRDLGRAQEKQRRAFEETRKPQRKKAKSPLLRL